MTTNNDTDDKYLSGIGIINSFNLSGRFGNRKAIYLDDYDVKKDFIIYFVPKDYDISTLANNASSIPESDLFIRDMVTSETEKWSLNKFVKFYAKNMIYSVNSGQYSEPSMVPDNDAINLLNIFKSNKVPLIKFIRLLLIAPFVYNITRTPFTRETGLGKDLYDLFTDGTSFSSSIISYIIPIEAIMDVLKSAELQ